MTAIAAGAPTTSPADTLVMLISPMRLVSRTANRISTRMPADVDEELGDAEEIGAHIKVKPGHAGERAEQRERRVEDVAAQRHARRRDTTTAARR